MQNSNASCRGQQTGNNQVQSNFVSYSGRYILDMKFFQAGMSSNDLHKFQHIIFGSINFDIRQAKDFGIV